MEDKKTKLLISKLQSNKSEEVVFTIKQLRNSGNSQILPHLFDMLIVNQSETIHAEAKKLLFDLKDINSKSEIIKALKSDRYKKLHKDILVSCWQSSLDYSDEVAVFVEIFKNSDFELAFEAFTIIDNFDNKIDASKLNPIISNLKENIANFKDTNKEQLFVELIHILENDLRVESKM